MTLTTKWTWEYEIRDLGSWPTRPPYAGHTEPVEIFKADEMRAAIILAIEDVKRILHGIDKDEVNDPTGWWETSAGARFGKEKLQALLTRLQEIVR